MKLSIQYIIILVLVLGFAVACEPEETNCNCDPTMITVATDTGHDGLYKVDVYANDSLHTGYNQLFFRITDLSTGNEVNDPELALEPIMHMSAMSHSAPYENPVYNSDQEMYQGAVVFIMPSNETEEWHIHLGIDGLKGIDEAHLEMPLVKQSDPEQVISFANISNGKNYFMTLTDPMDPKVGKNDFEVAIYERLSMMEFPAVDGLSLYIDPRMPSMGNHTSPENVNPVDIEKGHYKGSVNFTMTGLWRINVDVLQSADTIASDTYFDISFQ